MSESSKPREPELSRQATEQLRRLPINERRQLVALLRTLASADPPDQSRRGPLVPPWRLIVVASVAVFYIPGDGDQALWVGQVQPISKLAVDIARRAPVAVLVGDLVFRRFG